MKPRIYTYRVKFQDTPFYYWGVHKERVFGEEYLGSPVTNRWAWDFYYPELEILEVFPCSEEGWLTAGKIERRLIKPCLDDPYCLNENCGGLISFDALARRSKEGLARGGSAALKKAIERNPNHQSEAGRKGGIKGGARSKELKVGICGISTEERRMRGKEVAAQRWECLVTGHVSSAASLTRWQNKRDIDTSLRRKLDGNG